MISYFKVEQKACLLNILGEKQPFLLLLKLHLTFNYITFECV
ncbi:MAG: hypothetical protein ACFWTQ_07135 [Lactococcus sp.]|jgi:hypothetical protein